MKTLADIQGTLLKFAAKYSFPVEQVTQGSAKWLEIKLGVISASNASAVVAKKDSETRLTYMCDLVSEVATGVIEEINAKAMAWGKDHEDAARACYEFERNVSMTQVGFVFKDDTYRTGCSPDGLLIDRGAEIKCPFNSSNYIKFMAADKIKSEWQWQVAFCQWVLDADLWDVAQYDPRMQAKPIHVMTVERDEAKKKTLEDAVPQFIHDMDKMLDKVGVKFGSQWKPTTSQTARAASNG